MSEQDNLYRQAAIQDQLLQSYRSFQFLTQSILLAIGVFVNVNILNSTSTDQSISLLILQCALFLLALYLKRKIYGAIRSRCLDVDYWQGQILKAEETLTESNQQLTHFKKHQKARNGQSANPPALLEKHLGHSRQVLDVFIPRAFVYLWVILFLTAGLSFL